MTKLTCVLLFLLASSAMAQESAKRPVFMSASRLADLCKNFLEIPVGYADKDTYSASPKQVAQALGCISYLEGIADQASEPAFDDGRYTPQNARLSDAQVMVEYFVKYMARHPEDKDLAASTVIHRCENMLENIYGKPKTN